MLCCVLLALLLPLPMAAAQTAGPGCGAEAVALAPAGSGPARVDATATTGAWRFEPGRDEVAGVPGQTAAGSGWRSGPLDGVVPAGTWCLTATIGSDVDGTIADGQLLAAVYAVGADGSRLLGIAGTEEVFGDAITTVILERPLGEVVLHDELLQVDWYLTITRHQDRGVEGYDAGARTTTLSVGDLALPAAPTPHPLEGATRVAVTDPQDHRVTVTWAGSSDDRVTGYEVLGGPAEDALAPLGTVAAGDGDGDAYAFRVDGLVNREPAFFTVVGVTAAGESTPHANLAQGRAVDRTLPEAPAAPTVVPDGSGVLRLTWPASVAPDLASYRVERAATARGPFETVARDLTTRVHRDTDLPPQSTWWYRIRAVDDDGLVSEASPTVTTTTAPGVPTGLHLAAVGDGTLTIGWDGSSRPLRGYRVERATGGGAWGSVGGLVTGTTFTDTGLANGTVYRYRVSAEDRRGVRSSPSDALSASPRASAAPLPPTYLTVTDAGRGAALEWGASPSRDVAGYQVLRAVDGGAATELGGVHTGTTATDRSVEPGRRYEYTVVAVDGADRRSPPTNGVTYVVQPTTPASLQATPTGTSTVRLSWSSAGDRDVAYEVWRAEGTAPPAIIARTDASTLDDTGLLLETEYRYFVRAVAAGFRASSASNTVAVTLRDGPPSPPAATAVDTTEGGSIEVRWEPPAEPDVTSWRIDRRVAGDARWDVVADVPQPHRSSVDEGLTDGVRYEYRVTAVDRGGAESDPSAVTSAVPSDTTPPATPAAPTVRLTVGALAVDWDVVPSAVRYEVLRADAPGGPFRLLTATSLRAIRDTDVSSGTTYHYRVVAIDAAGNASPPSPAASGTFRTAVSPGAVVPVSRGGGRPAPVPGAAGGVGGIGAPAPANPFDPTRPLFPGLGQVRPDRAGVGVGVGAGGIEAPADATVRREPAPGRSILAFPPELGGLRDAVSAGDLPAAVGRVIGEVAGNVPDVARTFSIPLLLVVVILLYLVAQGRIDRDAAVLTVEAPAGGDQDDVEFLL